MKGIIIKKKHLLPAILAIAMLSLLLSCEFAASKTNDINIVITCSSGTFDVEQLILDGKEPYSMKNVSNSLIIPVGDISKLIITVKRSDETASLIIAIYNNNEFDENGYATLESCTAGATACTNNKTLQYEVEGDDSEGAAASTTTEESSSE